jgi:hypothetical protein
MLKQFTFLALALVGLAMLFLDQNNGRFGQVSKFVWVAEHPKACTRGVVAPVVVHPHLFATTRTSSLRFRFNSLQARVRASIAKLQAGECCWFNSLDQKLHDKSSTAISPAWRDVHYDAQQLAKMLGFCKQEPV